MEVDNDNFTAPKDKQEILDKIQTLTFTERLQYGSDIGRKCSNANELISELRNNPPPAVPNVELDEGLCEILAPQERNVSKYYHQHQIALTAAVSSKNHVQLLKEEIQSQSKFFKKMVIKHYVKQEQNDGEIVSLVKSVAPFIQKKIIHCLIREKRTKALDILCDEMRKIAGIDFMVDFLHGCSSEKVRESLNFKNIFEHKALRWDKLFRFHQKMIIEMMTAQVSQATLQWGRYNAIYTIWTKRDKKSIYKKNRLSAWEQMLETDTYQSKALWELVLKYPHSVIDPCLTFKEKKEFEKEIAANGYELKTFNDIRIKKIVPDFIRNRFNYFTRRNPELFLEFLKETIVINLRGVIRHSIPGKLWTQKDFKPKYIFQILEMGKAKSTRKLLFPYHEMVNKRNMKRWTYNMYTNAVSAVCTMTYGSKLKNKVGFDHLLICQITRAKTKKSVFFSFGPGQMTKLINFIYDWMEEMKPKGIESDIYDQMGWIELLNQWTTNWLTKLYTKRNKKEGKNRYESCIVLLIHRWQKLWDQCMTNPWREAFPQRMRALEKLVRNVYSALKFWKYKCEHETREEPTSKELEFGKQIENLMKRIKKDGYYHGKDKIKRLFDGFGAIYNSFNNYTRNMTVNVSDKYKYYGSRRWPLKNALQSMYSLVKTFITQESHAQYAFDYFVSFHVMRNVRKIRSKERYNVLDTLLKVLYERRPVYYELSNKDEIISDNSSDFKAIYRSRLSEWLSLYEQIISEIWDECLDRKRVQSEYGWNIARTCMEQYLKAYQFIIAQKQIVSTDISHWFYVQTKRQRYGFFRAGGNNTSFQKKPYNAPSIIYSIITYIKTNKYKQCISLKLIREMFEYYLTMLQKIKPSNSMHCLYPNWVKISENSQRQLITELQKYLSKKQTLIDKWDKSERKESEEVTNENNLTRECVQFVSDLFPKSFQKLLAFYSKPARCDWVRFRDTYERIWNVLNAWDNGQPRRSNKDVARAWNNSDRTHYKALTRLQRALSQSSFCIAPKQERKLLECARGFSNNECKTANDCGNIKLPTMHSDNQRLLRTLKKRAYTNWDAYVNKCASQDRTWLAQMLHICDLFECFKYDYIYKIYTQFIAVFEQTQFWTTHKDNMSNLKCYWRRTHLKTMQRLCQLLTRTCNTLDTIRSQKRDILKQVRHKTSEIEMKDGGDNSESDMSFMKDGTFETQEMTKIWKWISEIILKCFALEFNEEYTAEPHKWWKPDLLYLFEHVILYAPNDNFAELFMKMNKYIVDEMKNGNTNLLQLLIRRLKSKMRCENQKNWEILWDCFVTMRSKLENKFDDYCCDLMINLETTQKEREIIFGCVATDEHLKILCNQRPKVFVKLFGALCDFPNRTSNDSRTLANQFLDFFLSETEHNASPDTKDQLLRYLDVRSHKIRKRLAKLTDSNSVDEREAGYRTLITATLLVNDAERDTHIKRTVKFFMTKLKNEAIERREMGLEILFGELANQSELLLESDECLKYLTEMLQDCLEVQDLDKGEDNKEWENIHEHKVLRHFLQLSVDAIQQSCKDFDGPLFEFGVELQWRMCVFRLGNENAAKLFRINMGKLVDRNKVLARYLSHMKKYGTAEGESFDGIYFYEDEEDTFVEKYMKAYETRTKLYFPQYLESSVSATSFMEHLFLVLGANWHKSKVLIELLNKLISDFEDLDLVIVEEDEFGLGIENDIIGKDVEAATAKIVCYIVEFNKHNWIDISVLGKFVNALFAAFKSLHTQGYDNCLRLTQKTLIFMLDSLLYEYTKSERARKEYKDDWASHKILKLLIEKCFEMLSVTYPQKSNGRFWIVQWELHKVFRSRMMKCDADIDTILHIENVNDLPTFKWTLFSQYWDVCANGLRFAIDMCEKDFNAKDMNTMDEDNDSKMEELDIDTAKERKDHKERVISLFNSDEEREIWRLELAVWCVDMACQWVWGGDWLEIAQSPVALLIQNSADWKGFMIIPTQTVFSTVSKPILRFRWNECTIIRNVFAQVLRSLKIINKKDIEGLAVFEKTHPALVIFEKLVTKYHCNRARNIKMRKKYSQFWYEMDLINEYMNVVMRSRQIKIVLWRWWAYNSTNKIVKKNGRKIVTKYVKSNKKRTIAIEKLLNITKSAIYLRFVWRHLLQYSQNRLTQFLESGECFRGVFYLNPGNDRKYTRKQQRDRESRKAEMAARFESAEKANKNDRVLGVSGALKKEDTNQRKQRKGGGKEATRRILDVQAAKRKELPVIEQELSAIEQVRKEFEDQKNFEASFEEWKLSQTESKEENDTQVFDHADLWCFEGCYQLNRLLPAQLLEIGKRHKAAAMNVNRGMPERVKSIIRWTLLPNTTFNDIIDFFNANTDQKLPINLLEALMKGVMENDEVLAPMHYLLQPQFLSSQQARIAAFAIQKCVPHIPRRQYTNLLRAVLSGKRRNALKVTAYKQIIRMLIQQPSRTHIRMVVHEWDRNEVHRDVRIVILQSAFDFIRRAKPISFGSDAAWHIFESAVTHPFIRRNIEIMTTLMGCTIEGQDRVDDWYKGLVLKPRLLDHLQCFKDTPVPKKHAQRWAKIIIVLCDRVYTEVYDEEDTDETMAEGDDTKDETGMDVESESKEETKDGMEVEVKEDDGSGPYLKNEGKKRCLDDIAYIAMRSLEMWVKYNDSIVRDALRCVGECICDFNIDFIAHENEDVHKVNWNRFEMAVDILKKTLKFNNQTHIRHKFVPVITDILGRFDAIINADLDRFVDVYGYGAESTFTVSDRYAQSRDYIGRVHKRLATFMEKLGSFAAVPCKYYKSIIAPLDSGNSRGMYTDIVMSKRWEMLSNLTTRGSVKYFDLCIDYVQDLIYYSCLDPTFANTKVKTNVQNILSTIGDKNKAKLMRILIKNSFPPRNKALYKPQILECEQYTHVRVCMIKYIFDNRLIGGECVRLLDSAFIDWWQHRIALLIESIDSGSHNSQWRERSLSAYTQIEQEIDTMLSFAVSTFRVQHNHKANATLCYHKLALKFFDSVCKKANALVSKDDRELCDVSDWVWLKIFNRMCQNNMAILVVLYGHSLVSLLRMPIFLAEKRFTKDKTNPFIHKFTVSQLLDRMYAYITDSYFYDNWESQRHQIISAIFRWLLDPQRDSQKKNKKFRKNVLITAIKCLTERKYQSNAWDICHSQLLKVWDMIAFEKCKSQTIDNTKSVKAEETKTEQKSSSANAMVERDPIILGTKAMEMYEILNRLLAYAGSITGNFSHFNALFHEILNRAINNSGFNQRIFLKLMTSHAARTVFVLHNQLQRVFDLAIDLSCEPPLDGKGGLKWHQISDFIEIICVELSPKWRKSNTLNHRAIKLIEGLFKAFTSTPLLRQSELDKKAKVYRNVCVHLLCAKVQLIQYALTNKLANALKYLIDIWQIHRNLTRKNSKNVCFASQARQGFGIVSILKSHIQTLNNRLYTHRSVEPISGALICQIYKNAVVNKAHKNREICGFILYEFMVEITDLLTQAIFSPDLVKMVSWSIDYKTQTNNNVSTNNIIAFITKSSKYLSPSFSLDRRVQSIAMQYYKLLVNDYCTFDLKCVYSPRVKDTISELLKVLISDGSKRKWLITVCAPQSLQLIYALTLQCALDNISTDLCTTLIISWIDGIESEAQNSEYWTRINFSQANKGSKNKGKKQKLSIDDMYKFRGRYYKPETLQIIHRIFKKDLLSRNKNNILSETNNAVWNDYVSSHLMIKIMDRHAHYLMRATFIPITSTFVIALVSYMSQSVLRYSASVKSKLIAWFLTNLNGEKGTDSDRTENMREWIKWLLTYRKEMDHCSKDIMTRLALSLVVNGGYKSCKKAKRIEHEMSKEKLTETQGMETDSKQKPETMETDDNKSEASFESESDDVITWQPQWIDLLNEFSNDENAVIRMATRKVKTVFVDWEQHKKAKDTWVKAIVNQQ